MTGSLSDPNTACAIFVQYTIFDSFPTRFFCPSAIASWVESENSLRRSFGLSLSHAMSRAVRGLYWPSQKILHLGSNCREDATPLPLGDIDVWSELECKGV